MRKTLPDGSVIEGKPSEIAEYEAMVRFHGLPNSEGSTKPDTDDEEWEFVSSEVAFRALTRIKLAPKVKAVLAELHTNKDTWTSAKALQKLIDYKPPQFAGLMGAFGRRVANTPGFVRNSSFFDYEWDDGAGCYLYRLSPGAREAVERVGLV